MTRDKTPHICPTPLFHRDLSIQYATQSGPMLVIDGTLHPAFQQASANLNIRNGVGILPDGAVLFAMSAVPVNFYEFATFFRDMGCSNALYLDGLVSRMYFPAGNVKQLDGKFGVIIGVVRLAGNENNYPERISEFQAGEQQRANNHFINSDSSSGTFPAIDRCFYTFSIN